MLPIFPVTILLQDVAFTCYMMDTSGENPISCANGRAPAPKRRRRVNFYWAEIPTVVYVFTTGGGFHLPVSASDLGL